MPDGVPAQRCRTTLQTEKAYTAITVSFFNIKINLESTKVRNS
ncbi:hypothetical protein CCAND95_80020 [Capnocytophaga canis]|nr:hypothetical protein CCAND95_80020 [Capnocytophaga canis]